MECAQVWWSNEECIAQVTVNVYVVLKHALFLKYVYTKLAVKRYSHCYTLALQPHLIFFSNYVKTYGIHV